MPTPLRPLAVNSTGHRAVESRGLGLNFDPTPHVCAELSPGEQNAYDISDIGRTYSGDDRPDDRGL
jgi:hypothetical protein